LENKTIGRPFFRVRVSVVTAGFRTVPIIDLFAGPGGLGEGFSAFTKDELRFKICLSVEKDPIAHQTLELRSFFRAFEASRVPDQYYEYLRNSGETEILRRQKLFAAFPEEASAASTISWKAELGEEEPSRVHDRISHALNGAQHWILIGGPPCQAYSLVGRSRNKGNPDYSPERDKRQRLYLEYIQVLADHLPDVFVLENVKGLLSAKFEDQEVFQRMVEDLEHPDLALKRADRSIVPRSGTGKIPRRYRVLSLVDRSLFEDHDLRRFVAKMEDFGVPQARHRVIVMGVRRDLGQVNHSLLTPSRSVSIDEVISGLPRLRSGLSKGTDSFTDWQGTLRSMVNREWFSKLLIEQGVLGLGLMETIENLRHPRADRGAEFVPCDVRCDFEPDWFLDERLGGVCNHSSRGHIAEDLHRYLFAASFAKVYGRSPSLAEFPRALLPKHQNVGEAMKGALFADRFRVQVRNRPSTTITSHIAKDGHYYIHYDASQCRSLTVREAARVQTFPDNYFFCGPRTAQYTQVGNAVPPLFARQIAGSVASVLRRAGL
jgi:DNA (cytosine-5)-methyltransferase 1